jgi:hypothetical protein
MLYAFPAAWTVGGQGTSLNKELSKPDRDFVGSSQMYPGVGGAEVRELPVNSSLAAALSSPGEQDTYRFQAKSAADYVIETGGTSDVMCPCSGRTHRPS